VTAESREALGRWRLATRTHFQWAFLHGYRVTALHRDRLASRAFYVLRRETTGGGK
jgi:predicted GNAT superfamily acetyltransferase